MDFPDNSSRRAFPLNSRAVWVEQQLVHQLLLPRDNLSLGPGEYSPVIPSRHITTPVLGKLREPVDYIRAASASRSPNRRSISPPSSARQQKSVLGKSDAEFKTIFHNSDERQGLDPKLRFCETSGPSLPHDEVLRSVSVLGVNEVHKTVQMQDSSTSDRFPVKQALPVYDIKYDSNHVRSRIQNGGFGKDKRIYIPFKDDPIQQQVQQERQQYLQEQQQQQPNSANGEQRTMMDSPGRRSVSPDSKKTFRSITEARCSLVRLPKVKTNPKPKFIFDDSSYQSRKLAKPLDLNPALVNKKAYVHLFDKYMIIPHKHKSPDFRSPSP